MPLYRRNVRPTFGHEIRLFLAGTPGKIYERQLSKFRYLVSNSVYVDGPLSGLSIFDENRIGLGQKL